MNERIKELAEQAGMVVVDDEFSTYGKFAEKFAELIVKECAKVGDSGDPLQDGGIARMIKQHFGVE